MTAIDVGTIVAPGVILDRRTQDELQPPCEAGDVLWRGPCDAPAEWVLGLSCGCPVPPVEHFLLCGAHSETVLHLIADGRAAGLRCGQRLRVETLERLR